MATTVDFKGSRMLSELREFGSFSAEAQRYICRSIEVAFVGERTAGHWARDGGEAESIKLQGQVYESLPRIRSGIPKAGDFVDPKGFLLPLMEATAFDISGGWITNFREYHFLYERLLGAAIRPWLSSAFLSAAGLPYFSAADRKSLISSIAGTLHDDWEEYEPVYWPRWLGDGEALAA